MDGPLTRGILDFQLLRKLWLGEDTNIDFLVNLMVHIGVVAILPIADSNGFQRFLVPAMITEQMNVGDFSESKVLLKYLNITSVDGEYRISFRFDQDFTPAAYYNRVVTRLVTVWRESYTKKDPTILPNGCLLSIGHVRYVLILNTKGDTFIIDVLTSTKDHNDVIIPHVSKAMTDINNEMYRGNLHFGHSGQTKSFDLEQVGGTNH